MNPNLPFRRPDGRKAEDLRQITLEPGIAPHANGSVLCSFGNTRVICAATLQPNVPRWMREQNINGGWLTAEYSMLPYSTLDRKQREISRGKADSRGTEISRLIGRSLRAVCDLQKLPGYTLWIDCDVLQADGGTRTASITGAYVAAYLGIARLMADGKIKEQPFRSSVSAISVGIFEDEPVLDLDYIEDSNATVDANVVIAGTGRYVEVQASGEEATYSPEELSRLLELANLGCTRLKAIQEDAIQATLPKWEQPASTSGQLKSLDDL